MSGSPANLHSYTCVSALYAHRACSAAAGNPEPIRQASTVCLGLIRSFCSLCTRSCRPLYARSCFTAGCNHEKHLRGASRRASRRASHRASHRASRPPSAAHWDASCSASRTTTRQPSRFSGELRAHRLSCALLACNACIHSLIENSTISLGMHAIHTHIEIASICMP